MHLLQETVHSSPYLKVSPFVKLLASPLIEMVLLKRFGCDFKSYPGAGAWFHKKVDYSFPPKKSGEPYLLIFFIALLAREEI